MSFRVSINDDNHVELTEQFSVRVSLADSLPVEITPNVASITILDDDGECRTKLLMIMNTRIFSFHHLHT